MAAKTGKKIKGKGISRFVKAFLKGKSKRAKSALKKPAAKKRPALKKAPAVKRSVPRKVALRKATPLKKAIPPKTQKAARSAATSLKTAAPQQPGAMFISEKSPIAGPRYFFHTDIPDVYNDTYMRALPRDPEWIFVYWEISESSRSGLKGKMGEAAYHSSKKLLRLYDVTDRNYDGSNAQSYTDIEINDYANNWYIRVPEPGKTYLVECGFLTSEGRFFLAVRSNAVNVPHFGLSARRDGELEGTDELLRMSSAGLKRGLGASEKRFGALAERGESSFGIASGSGSGGVPGKPGSRA
jgi:hypothetical protein